MITFTIPGEPRPWKRAKGNGKLRFTDAEMRQLKNDIGVIARAHCNKPIPPNCGVVLTLRFYLKPPKNLKLTQRPYPTKRPDFDNLEKLIADALNGIAYHDDSQVVVSHTYKWWAIGGRPRTEVLIHPLTQEAAA